MTKEDALEILAWFHANQNKCSPGDLLGGHRVHFGYVAALFISFLSTKGIHIADEDVTSATFHEKVAGLTPKWMLREETPKR